MPISTNSNETETKNDKTETKSSKMETKNRRKETKSSETDIAIWQHKQKVMKRNKK